MITEAPIIRLKSVTFIFGMVVKSFTVAAVRQLYYLNPGLLTIELNVPAVAKSAFVKWLTQ